MQPIRHALIMAAGRGQRMLPLTAAVPKAMAPYNGSTLIREAIRQIAGHVEQIHVTVGHKGPMLAEYLIENQVNSLFNTTGHGNAWWLYNTPLALVDEPVLVATCDNVVELDFAALGEEFARCGQPACMIVPVKPVPGRDGDYLFCEENVIVDITRERKSEFYCSGIQILNPVRINRMTAAHDDFRSLWRELIPLKQLIASTVMPRKWLAFDTIGHLIGSDAPAAT